VRWLISEDALRDRKGHWFEYLGTFVRELRALGDDVTLLADAAAENFLVEQLGAKPALPPSIWHRMGDNAGFARRYLRVPGHGWQTYSRLRRFLSRSEDYDVIFVPTVLVHHLLGWTALIKWTLKKSRARIVLFFPNTPVQLTGETGEPAWERAPTAKLFHRLVRSLRKEVKQGRVILGVETQPMRQALTQLSGVPFTYFPHPVAPVSNGGTEKTVAADGEILMGSYGGARQEKGSDVLVAAVDEYTRRYPDSRVRFALQSVGGPGALWGRLEGNAKVRIIPNYFGDGEYAKQLLATDCLLLPYRRSSYALRVSRVVIEALVQGIPVVVTRGTTLADQAKELGAPVMCEDGDVESLVQAIRQVELQYQPLSEDAKSRRKAARDHFSVARFRQTTLEGA
jgi:glycosyltransferase involved in cell wall biosynthesis